MKTILTIIFAIAVMVFAFNTDFVMAREASPDCPDGQGWAGEPYGCIDVSQMENLKDLDQTDKETDVADSGNEGTTSAAQESDQ